MVTEGQYVEEDVPPDVREHWAAVTVCVAPAPPLTRFVDQDGIPWSKFKCYEFCPRPEYDAMTPEARATYLADTKASLRLGMVSRLARAKAVVYKEEFPGE